MIAVVSGVEYQFPEYAQGRDEGVWKLEDVVWFVYDFVQHINTLQRLWEVLHLMEYYTAKGKKSRSLRELRHEQVVRLVDVMSFYRKSKIEPNQFAFPGCEDPISEKKIILNPKGFVAFDENISGIHIIK